MIGLFVTAAATIVIFILMFLHPRIGDDGKRLRVRFANIDKVTLGTRVTYGGKPVGEVVGIREVELGRDGPKDSTGRIYLYELELRVDSSVDVYNTDEVSLRTSGLLGEKNLEISPFAPLPGQPVEQIDKEVIYAKETGSVEDTFKEFKEVADKMDVTLDALTDTIYRIRDQKLIEKLSQTVKNLESITTSLNKPKEWSETLTNIHRLSQNMLTSWHKVDPLLDKAYVTFENLDKAALGFHGVSDGANVFVTGAQEMLAGISRGEGTLGKFLAQDDFYLRTSSLFSKAETVLDDINHYGLLFHNDKGWQRLRARRANLLQKLCSPQEFRNYFNDEIDEISASLARVSMVLEQVNGSPCCIDLLQDREYTKVFAELMRRISTLEEEVRLYNIQAVEAQVHTTELNNMYYPTCEQTPCRGYDNQKQSW